MKNTKTVVAVSEVVLGEVKNFSEATKAEKFAVIEALVLETLGEEKGAEIADFLAVEAERIEKRNSKRSKVESKTAKQKNEDIALIENFYGTLENEQKEVYYSGAELIELIGFEDYTSQRMTSRLTQMVKDGSLIKDKATSDKKKVGYKLADLTAIAETAETETTN